MIRWLTTARPVGDVGVVAPPSARPVVRGVVCLLRPV